MKNVFLLSTFEKSNLIKNYIGELELNWTYDLAKFDDAQYQQLYITNSELIHEGEWFFNSLSNTVHKSNYTENFDYQEGNRINSKVVLTTDKNLINHGVQVIPDEFLKWYIEKTNDSGVPIDIVKIKKFVDVTNTKNFKYRIILPECETIRHSFIDEVIEYIETFGNGTSQLNKTLKVDDVYTLLKELSLKEEKTRDVADIVREGVEWQKKRSYTKTDLRNAWIHGDIRSPKEFKHLNSFDEWFNHYKKE